MKKSDNFAIYIHLVTGVLLLALLAIISSYYVQKISIEQRTLYHVPDYEGKFNEYVDSEASKIDSYLKLIKEKPELEELFINGDRDGLYKKALPTFEHLKSNGDITHFYFIKPSGEVLLRVHDRFRFSDIVNRYTFLKSKENLTPFYGLEFGLKKNYTLRVVHPWIIDGKLIGFVELGKEVDKVIKSLSEQLGIEIYFAVDKSVYANSPDFVKDRIDKVHHTKNKNIVYQTTKIPENIETLLDADNELRWVELEDNVYINYLEDLKDVSGQKLGKVLYLVNITMEYNEFINTLWRYGTIMVLGTFMMLVIGFLFARQSQAKINSTLNRLREAKQKAEELSNEQKKKDQEIREKLQKFIDTQDSIVILSDSNMMQFANKKFLDFFGFNSLEEFKTRHSCICERFIEQENFFHLGKLKSDKENWVESLLKLTGRERVVSMIDCDSIPHAFSVSVSIYEKDQYVINFSDISDTMIEKLELKKEATQDELTKLYNRIYFNKNISSILESHKHHNMLTGVIFFDIDHFKSVNDTYGHDVGDYVLKNMANIIKKYTRNDDKIIRWGGEEFVILAEVDSKEALLKMAEHLRSVIENHEFEYVKSVTCSFGCAIHEDTHILNTVKVADEKLYEAKRGGRNRVEI